MKEMTGCGLTWLVRDNLSKETAFLSGSETHLGAFERFNVEKLKTEEVKDPRALSAAARGAVAAWR